MQPGDPKSYPMIYFLKKEHFELMHMQMEREEHSKISLKSISELTDIPMNKSTASMFKHICNFESYLSTHNGIEGFPLDYVVQSTLTHLPWDMMSPAKPERESV